jgi:hypothetical protein
VYVAVVSDMVSAIPIGVCDSIVVGIGDCADEADACVGYDVDVVVYGEVFVNVVGEIVDIVYYSIADDIEATLHLLSVVMLLPLLLRLLRLLTLMLDISIIFLDFDATLILVLMLSM